MIIGPKYKIARRLGKPIFEKTQTQKFALRQAQKSKSSASRPRAKTDYGLQVLEKQRARFSYGLTEKQFSKYVKKSLDGKGDSTTALIKNLESRLDNAVLRSGIALTRAFARQMVSHGHIMVNGGRVTIPSYEVKVGDVITIREGSKKSKMFESLAERMKSYMPPAWIKHDYEKGRWEIQGNPTIAKTELMFNIASVLEFYSR